MARKKKILTSMYLAKEMKAWIDSKAAEDDVSSAHVIRSLLAFAIERTEKDAIKPWMSLGPMRDVPR